MQAADWSWSNTIAGIALLVAVGALIVSTLSYRLARVKHDADLKASHPLIEIRCHPIEGTGGCVLRVDIQNRFAENLRIDEFQISRPKGFKLLETQAGAVAEALYGPQTQSSLLVASDRVQTKAQIPGAGSTHGQFVIDNAQIRLAVAPPRRRFSFRKLPTECSLRITMTRMTNKRQVIIENIEPVELKLGSALLDRYK